MSASTKTQSQNSSQIDLIKPIEKGFVEYSRGNSVVPPVGELIFDDPPGDVHIKYGYIKGQDLYCIKIASGFYSKPEVFAQCRNWLSSTFEENKTIAVASSARASQMAAEEPNTAAIGSTAAAELYGLKMICENIEDNPNNVTRFLIISTLDAKATGDDKTAALFSTAHKAGALTDVLNVFKDYDINLTNIESRPSKKREWEYYFFVDFLGHKTDDNVVKGLEEIRKHCLQLSILGSFPRTSELI